MPARHARPLSSGSAPARRVTAELVRGRRGRLTAPRPVLDGTARVGERLVARLGDWCPGRVARRVRWYVGGELVPGARGPSLMLTRAHAGERVVVRVTGATEGYSRLTLRSRPTSAVRRQGG